MRVLFLDIDGVINSAAWFTVRKRPDHNRALSLQESAAYHFDPEAVERVNRVTSGAGAVVCLSSTWRLGDQKQWTRTRKLLRVAGIEAEIVDRTPNNGHADPGAPFHKARRGSEIWDWLQACPTVTGFAIVDDDSDMGPLLPRLVQTTWDRGLQDEHVERLIAVLAMPKLDRIGER